MRDTARCWAALASLGAGLLNLAVAPHHQAPVGAVLALAGAFHLGWALAALAATRRVPLGATTSAVAAGLSLTWVASRLGGVPPWGGAAAVGDGAVLAVVGLELTCATCVFVAHRVRRTASPTGRIPFVALAAGAFAMSAVVTPALASTAATLDPGHPHPATHSHG